MPVEEGDEERWAELPGGGGSDEEGNSSGDSDDGGHISSLSADDGAAGTLLYPLPSALSSTSISDRRTLSISHDSTQGLAARVWPSAAMLVEFIAAEVEREKEKEREVAGDCGGDCNDDGANNSSKKAFSWRGASVLELGSGPGLTGIAVAALAGSRVLLTDLEGPALTLARRNVEGNAAEIEEGGGSVAVAALPWGERGAARRAAQEAAVSSSGIAPHSFFNPEAVIAADVIYDGVLFSPLLETLEELAFGEKSESGGSGGDDGNGENDASASSSSYFRPPRILIAHVRRWKRDARFWAAAKRRFEVIDVTPGRRKSEKAGEEAEGAEGSEGEGGDLRRRYSSHEKGALRVFELVPKKKINKSRQ